MNLWAAAVAAAIIGLGVALSRDRRSIRWRVVAWGLGLQVTFAIFVLRVPAGQALFRELGAFVTAVLHYSYAGSAFVFGELGKPDSKLGVVFALQILPAIIYVSALFAIMISGKSGTWKKNQCQYAAARSLPASRNTV